MKANVERAVAEIREGLPGLDVVVKEDGDGGAFVIVNGVRIGECYAPTSSWIGFQITFPYPDADVYPHFIDTAVKYVGNGEAPNAHPDGNLPTALSRGAMMPGFDRPAIQISRRSNRRDPETDSALLKLIRIVEFLRSR